jgi:hypothetical protein
VGVEPTIRSAKGRIGGFEGRDSHRTIFASAWIIDHHDSAPGVLAGALLAPLNGNCIFARVDVVHSRSIMRPICFCHLLRMRG